MNALNVSYENKNDFKPGECIIHETENIKRIMKVVATKGKILAVESLPGGRNHYESISFDDPYVRHATAEEISVNKRMEHSGDVVKNNVICFITKKRELRTC